MPPPVELEIFDGLKAVEPYDEDDDQGAGPAGARRLREAIESADAVLIATPEYNSSIPGQLKNAIDWASRPLARQRTLGQARGGRRRQHRDVRRGLGTGRGPEDRRRQRCPGNRQGPARRACRRGDSRTTAASTTSELRERYVEILDELIALAEQVEQPSEELAA